MPWPFLYFPGDRLSVAELSGARLDGDVVEIGDAYMPADAVETRELRAGSLGGCVSTSLAVTRHSAAWIHGAMSEPPARHTVQRRAGASGRPRFDRRVVCREYPVSDDDLEVISGVWVTTPPRTLADLIRARSDGEDVDAAIDALLRDDPTLALRARDVLLRARGLRFKRRAVVELDGIIRARATASHATESQDEVTR